MTKFTFFVYVNCFDSKLTRKNCYTVNPSRRQKLTISYSNRRKCKQSTILEPMACSVACLSMPAECSAAGARTSSTTLGVCRCYGTVYLAAATTSQPLLCNICINSCV